MWELFWWALQGAQALLPRCRAGKGIRWRIVETIRKHRVTVMHFVPSMLNVFLEYLDGKDATSCKAWLRCGRYLPAAKR